MSVFDPSMLEAAQQALEGLSRAGLDPASFGPMASQPATPTFQRQKANILDYIAPVVDAIASYENPRRDRRNTWLAPALHGLASAYTGRRAADARSIAEHNAAELARVRQTNTSREAEAAANRKAFATAVRGQTVGGVLKTPEEVAAGKTAMAADRARAVATASREGTNAANATAGAPPVGSRAPLRPRPAPAPKGATAAEKRKQAIASILYGLQEQGIRDRYAVQNYLDQNGVSATLAGLGVTKQDILKEVPE